MPTDDLPDPTRRPRVFISYARSDGEALAAALRTRLQREQPGLALWQDRADLEGGTGWWRQIAEALEQVQFLVLVMTPAALASPWVQKEWLLAREKGVCVFPVKAMPDEAAAFAAMPRWMRKAQFYDLDREWDGFVLHLKAPCNARRVPFMAPDLPRDFIDRPGLLDRVLAALLREGGAGLQLSTALQGAGGLGKTTLAAAACHRSEVVSHFDDGVLWVTLGREPNLVEALGKFHVALTGRRPGFVDAEDAAQHLAQALGDRNCLLVIDDVWDSTHLKPFLRGGPGCFRLVTTRLFDLSVEIERLDVDRMQPGEAASLLGARLDRPQDHAAALAALAARLGHWPLLLELANGTLRHRLARGDRIAGALDYLERKLSRHGITAFDANNPAERQQAISRTLELSLDLLDPATRQRCVQLGVFPEDTEVPLEVVQCVWQTDDLDTEDALLAIDNVALVRFDVQAGQARLHDVVRAYLGSRCADLPALHAQLADALARSEAPAVRAYRWRWLTHHLHEAGRVAELRTLLGRFEWMRGKLLATDLAELIGEYARFPGDPGLAPIQAALRLASHVLFADPAQLATQLRGRLVCTGGPPELQQLGAELAAWDGESWLEPAEPLLSRPAGVLEMTLPPAGAAVRALALSPDGTTLAAGTSAGGVSTWSLVSGSIGPRRPAHGDRITALAWRPDGRRFVSTAADGSVRTWEPRSAEPVDEPALVAAAPDAVAAAFGALADLPAHRGEPVLLSVGPGGGHAVSAGADDRAFLWRLGPAPRRLRRWHNPRGCAVTAVAVDSTGGRIALGFEDGRLQVSDLLHDTTLDLGDAHDGPVAALLFATAGPALVSAGDDGFVRLWNPARAAATADAVATGRPLRTLAASADGQLLLGVDSEGDLVVRDAAEGGERQRQRGPGPWLVDGPDGRRHGVWPMKGALGCAVDAAQAPLQVLSGRDGPRGFGLPLGDGLVLQVDAHEGLAVWSPQLRRLAALELAGVALRRCVLQPGGRRAAFVDAAGAVRGLDLATGARTLIAAEGTEASALAIGPDGRQVAFGRRDGQIACHDWDGRSAVDWPAHAAAVTGLAFAPDGLLLSTGADELAHVWDLDRVARRQPGALASYRAEHQLTCGTALPAGRFAVADETGRVHLLRLRGRKSGGGA